jgi:hypothetical protein
MYIYLYNLLCLWNEPLQSKGDISGGDTDEASFSSSTWFFDHQLQNWSRGPGQFQPHTSLINIFFFFCHHPEAIFLVVCDPSMNKL